MIDQSDVVTTFTSLIGTKLLSEQSSAPSSLLKADPNATNSRKLLMCISKSVEHHEVVCTLPSLDMRKLDEDPETNPLPKVGEHFPQMKMEASVLHNAADASAKAAQVEQKAAQTLGSLTSWTRSSVVYASNAISENAANSFSSLVDSRVRAWTLLLLRHSLTTGDSTSRSRLLSMLASIIKVNSAEIAFKTQPLPEACKNLPRKDDDPDIILPLLFEVHMKIIVQSKECTVTLRAPGTVSGEFLNFFTYFIPIFSFFFFEIIRTMYSFLYIIVFYSFLFTANFDHTADQAIGMGLKTVDIRLDTGTLLESMVKEARMVVFNAVAKATSTSNSMSIDSDLKISDPSRLNAPSQLSGFSSALKLASSSGKAASGGGGGQQSVTNEEVHRPSHRNLKAKSSSLRLISVLSTAAPISSTTDKHALSIDKMKKSRSVQFDGHVDLKAKPAAISSPKRQKMATTARLTSFKSFGRPHAGDFGSGPKNATFGDFGGSQKFWGRDGKLASHPKPMLPSETTDMMTSQTRKNANATFDFQKPSIHLSRGTDLGISRKKNESSATLNQVPNSIPRTATALEGWLIEKTSSGNR